jgi:Uma2 family endonuclease
MFMPATQHDLPWTAERALALPDDGNRYEVLDGELFVTPSPSFAHQAVIGELFARLLAYTDRERIGRVLISPADIIFSPRRLVQPDIFVIPALPVPQRTWTDVKSLLLAVEVLSPSTARADRHRKRLIYQDQGVPEYWIVDADARMIERWRPSDDRPEVMHAELRWAPEGASEPLVLDLTALFRDALGPLDEPG